MIRCNTVLHLKDIIPIVEMEDDDVLMMIKNCINTPSVYIYMTNEKDALVVYLPLDNYKYNTHIYSLKSARGRKLKEFLIDSGLKMFNETRCTTILSFVDDVNTRLQLFLGAIGASRVGRIKNSSSYGDTILYSFYKEEWI